jgi:hypothetical protein
MATSYSGRYSRPLGAGDNAFGGAGLNLGIEALAGETEMITTFDDFNDRRDAAAVAGAGDPRPGWFSSVINVATGNLINLNDPGATPQPVAFQSSLRVLPGTIEDAGVNLQIVGGTDGSSPHVWIQDRDADAAGGDNTSIVFACRVGVGLAAAAAGEVWQGKFFVGFAISGDVQVLNNTTGEIDLATDGPLLGFHMAEDGHIDLISVRDGIAGPLVDGTHFTQLVDTSWNANLQPELGTANHQPTWFDLALLGSGADRRDTERWCCSG